MKSCVAALLLLSSTCNTPSRVFVENCFHAPRVELRRDVLTVMNREELIAYNMYREWWNENCQ
jgi:hypothetical protein